MKTLLPTAFVLALLSTVTMCGKLTNTLGMDHLTWIEVFCPLWLPFVITAFFLIAAGGIGALVGVAKSLFKMRPPPTGVDGPWGKRP